MKTESISCMCESICMEDGCGVCVYLFPVCQLPRLVHSRYLFPHTHTQHAQGNGYRVHAHTHTVDWNVWTRGTGWREKVWGEDPCWLTRKPMNTHTRLLTSSSLRPRDPQMHCDFSRKKGYYTVRRESRVKYGGQRGKGKRDREE